MRHLFPILFLLFLPVAGIARLQQSSPCAVSTGQEIAGNFYAMCPEVVIDGTVHGDVVALAGTVTVNGTVDRDLVAIAGHVIVNGTLDGDVRTLAADLVIQPTAQLTGSHADVTALGLNAHMMAPVSGDVLFGGYQTILDNTLGGNLRFWGSALVLNGPVNGDADVSVDSTRTGFRPPDVPGLGLVFTSPGLVLNSADPNTPVIKGNLSLQSPDVVTVPSGLVAGNVNIVSSRQVGVPEAGEIFANYVGHVLHDLLGLMLVGGIMLLTVQPWVLFNVRRLRTQPGKCLGYGFLALTLSFPISLLVILISVLILGAVWLLTLGDLTLMAGVLLLTANLGIIGGFWFVVLFPARVIVCYVIGQSLGRRVFPEADRVSATVISLLLGVLTYSVIAELPIGLFGWVINIGLLSWGLGAMVLFVRDYFLRRELSSGPHVLPVDLRPALPSSVTDTIEPPPEVETQPGMDNLPEGFTWFDN